MQNNDFFSLFFCYHGLLYYNRERMSGRVGGGPKLVMIEFTIINMLTQFPCTHYLQTLNFVTNKLMHGISLYKVSKRT